MDFERFFQVLERLRGYFQTEPLVMITEFAVIWIVVYVIFRFLQGTRGARVIKGVAVLLIVLTLIIQILGQGDTFERLNFLYSNFVTFASLILVIVFQPELRRALVRLGEARWFGQSGLRKARVAEEILGALEYLSRNKIGALVCIERQVGLKGIVEAGTSLNADVSKQLLQTIFWPGSALHDMAVIVTGDRISAAGVQLPLADSELVPPELGSRHRAAIGLSQESDALVLVVSEETGTISIAERGKLERGLTIDQMRPRLMKGMAKVELADANAAAERGGVPGSMGLERQSGEEAKT